MDDCFENRCEVNESMIVDYHRAQEKKMRTLRTVATAVCAIVLIKTLVSILLGHTATVFDMVTVAINLVALYLLWFSTPMVIKKTVGYFREFTGRESAELTYRFADTIQVICGENTMEFQYKQIMGIEFMTDHVMLNIPRKMMLFVAYDGFTKGTFEEFKQFLRYKRPDLKIPE